MDRLLNKEEKEVLLEKLSESQKDSVEAQSIIDLLLKSGGEEFDVLIPVYRYFFYGSDFERALHTGSRIRDLLVRQMHLPENPDARKRILSEKPDDPDVRLYLQTEAARGFLLARTGRKEEATKVLQAIQGIHPKDTFGSDGVLFFLENQDRDDSEED